MSVKIILLVGTALIALPGMALAQDTASTDAAKDTSVVVKGQKKPVTKKIDKTVYNAGDNPKSESGTAQDVLQSTPSVSVSPDGNIAVKGNANATVLINGKPSAVMAGENRAVALQTMAGSDIASVEVLTNPSAAYNANGGAIINIILKKSRKPGAHGSLRGSVSDQRMWNTNFAGDYSKGKLSVHLTAGLRRDGTLKFRGSDIEWHDPITGHSGQTLQSSEVFVRRMTQNAALGLDYDLSDTDSLSASASYNFRHSRPLFDEFDQHFTAGVLSDAFHHVSNGPNQQSDDALSLSYARQTEDTILKAALQHSDTINLVDKSYEDAFVYPLQPSDFAHVMNKAARHLDEASLDYTRPLLTTGQLGLGVDYQRDSNTLDNAFATIDPLTGVETIDPAITHRYRVIEIQRAAYVTALMTWADKWQALIGARYEAVTTRLESAGQPSINGADYQSLNPSLHLKYSFDAERSLTLSYRQSLQRPDPRDLDPFLTYGDAQNRSTGNPNLKPQGVKSLELTFDADGKDMSRSVGAFYRKSSDTVVDFRSVTAGNILLTTKQNAGSGLSTGVNGSIDWRPSTPLHVSADASAFYVELQSMDLNGPVKQTGASYYANLSLDYSKGANELSLDAHLTGPTLVPQGQLSATNALNLTWKRHLTPRLNLNVSASDILDGAKQTYSTTTATFVQRGFNHFVARRIYIGVVYKLG